jgi:Asp-tRNA(Asn)/Glu-tRNA(Gln) amidotransferase A subunit family amidase
MVDRRRFLATVSGMGFGSTLLPGVLWALADGKTEITEAMLEQAAAIADVPVPMEQRKTLLETLNDRVKGYEEISKLQIPNSVPPALTFDPLVSSTKFETEKRPMKMSAAPAMAKRGIPKDLEELCFATARELAELVRSKKISSVALTQMYLERLKRYDPQLHFVITLTEERALTKAKEADRELAAGKYRGPLHGLPWGAKDLLAVAGYPTTWGAGGFEKQTFDEDATVVKRLDKAGAVLVAKLSLGALAMDDRWFGGKTRNPWNPAQGSSGSSAGSASAVAAGCVAFAIGSETLGSISSPSTRCGCTGLRPTFGLVPRTGAMALSWSMDKLGPICRSVEDTALALDAIYGPDGKDRSVVKAAFNWDAHFDWKGIRVGYLKEDFEKPFQQPEESSKPESQLSAEEKKARDEQKARREERRAQVEYDRKFQRAALEKLQAIGVKLEPVALPKFPYDAMVPLLDAEAAAAFDELTRTGRDKLLTEQGPDDWPTTFRAARFIPAVEYIQANRARMMAMEAVSKVFEDFDVIVAPTNSQQLVVTNLTGHPALILPNGFRGEDAPPAKKNDKGEIEGNYGGPGTPVSLTFLGGLFREANLLAVARAYQDATNFHLQHPKLAA